MAQRPSGRVIAAEPEKAELLTSAHRGLREAALIFALAALHSFSATAIRMHQQTQVQIEDLAVESDHDDVSLFDEDDVKEFMISGFSNMVAANDIQLNSMVYKKTSLHL